MSAGELSDRDDNFAIVDPNRSVQLDSVGGLGLTVVVAVDKGGCEHWGVIDRSACGNPASGFSMGSPEHEDVGPLPLETVRRIAAAGMVDDG